MHCFLIKGSFQERVESSFDFFIRNVDALLAQNLFYLFKDNRLFIFQTILFCLKCSGDDNIALNLFKVIHIVPHSLIFMWRHVEHFFEFMMVVNDLQILIMASLPKCINGICCLVNMLLKLA